MKLSYSHEMKEEIDDECKSAKKKKKGDLVSGYILKYTNRIDVYIHTLVQDK